MLDFALETTFDYKFTTRAFATGIPATLAGTPVVDIYEDNSTTQITGAETLTVDFDSVTGLNNLRIAATAANGFEAGKSYAAVITTGTVSSVSVVGEVIVNFTIERLNVASWNSVNLGTTNPLPNVAPDSSGGLPTEDANGRISADATALSGDATAANNLEADYDGTGYSKSNSTIGTCTTNTDMRGTDSAALASVCTEARLSELDEATAGKMANQVDEIRTDTGEIGTAGAGLSNMPWNAAWDAEVQSECTDALNAYDPPTKAELDAGLAALNDVSVADVLTTQMTESYAANGVAPTLAQSQFAVHQMLMQFLISGTSITVRQLDNSTPAFVVTLDDATNPSSAVRT